MLTSIASRTNDRVKRVCRLSRSAGARRESGLFLLEGLRLCGDAARNGVLAEEVYLTDRVVQKHPDEAALLERMARQVFVVDEAVFAKMSDTESSQGVLSVIAVDALPAAPALSPTGRYVACETVADPANLGAIARTAEALGVSGMLLFGSCCDRFNPKALRASMGALLRLTIYSFADLSEGMDALAALGITRYAMVVDPAAEPIRQAGFHPGSVAFIGNEANGLTPELVDRCDRRLTIPIAGRSESFNAAAAAAITLWELMQA